MEAAMAGQIPRLSFLKRLSLNVFSRYKKAQTLLHELNYLFWECTLRCNLCCLHCGSDCRAGSERDDMPMQDFLNVLDRVKILCNPNATLLALTGGEPLLRKDLEACGTEFYRRGFPWGMVTNGYAMTPARFEGLMASGLRSMTLSLDGLEASHNWLRGRADSYEKALHVLDYVPKAAALVFDVVTCVHQKNFSELEGIRQLLIERGVRKWRLFNIFPKGRAKDNPLLDVTNGQFRRLMEFIRQTRKEGRIAANYACEGFLGPYEGEARDGFFFCRAGISVGSVLADGSISACPSLRGDYVQGNIYADDFVDVWQNRFQVMRDRSWTKTGICKTCSAYKWCLGNGLHLREQQTAALLRCHLKILNDTPAP
jgi:radical SAM enzyme (rSAM/lipoprotein system)